MKKIIPLLSLITITLIPSEAQPEIVSISYWYHHAKNRAPDVKSVKTIATYTTFRIYLDAFNILQKNLLKTTQWLASKINFDKVSHPTHVQPFVLKYHTEGEKKLFMWGDLHGDIQAFTASLYKLYKEGIINDDLTIKNTGHLFFFLGDFTDRGEHGPDTLTLLFIFATQNPGHVFLLRGNHEDISLVKSYGFYDQLRKLYHQAVADPPSVQVKNQFDHLILKIKDFFSPLTPLTEIESKLIMFYNMLPVALFVGMDHNYIQCCHGGLEPRYNPTKLLSISEPICFEKIKHLKIPSSLKENNTFSGDLHITQQAQQIPVWQQEKKTFEAFDLGFLWNDFNGNGSRETTYTANRSLMLGRSLVEKLLHLYSTPTAQVRGVIRAHQHNDSMPGLFKPENTGVYSLWDNQVLTTIGTGIYTQAPAYIKLVLNKNFDEWKLTSYNLQRSGWRSKQGLMKSWKNTTDVVTK